MGDELWFNSFRLADAERALKDGHRDSLNHMVSWGQTPEGVDFWYEVYEKGMTPAAFLRLSQMVKEYKKAKKMVAEGEEVW